MQPLGSIKKWLGHRKNKPTAAAGTTSRNAGGAGAAGGNNNNNSKDMVVWSEAVERSYLEQEVAVVTSSFVPQAKGTEATLEWLERRTPGALSRLLGERDRAARQARRGPKDRGAKEVKEVLKRPCRRTVEQLHHVRGHAEATVRYGAATGAVVYSLGQSFRTYNGGGAPKLPSLQLKDFSTMICEQLESVSRLESSALQSPRNWFPTSRTPTPPPPLPLDTSVSSSNPRWGVWDRTGSTRVEQRDEEEQQQQRSSRRRRRSSASPTDSEAEDDPYEFGTASPSPSALYENAQEEWAAKEATFVTVVATARRTRPNLVSVRYKGKKGKPRPMPKIREASLSAGADADA